MKHPRAELIAKWMEDTTQPVWRWGGGDDGWVTSEHTELISWSVANKFAIGDKPTGPPQKMCTLAGVSFPVPLSVASGCEVGITVWRNAGEDSATHYVYGFNDMKDASACAKAIAEAIEQAIKEAK